MKTTIQYNHKIYSCNLRFPYDISIPLSPGDEGVNCFYAPPVKISPVVAGDFIGSTKQGGVVNFMNIELNPHGNGTHTECVGHIATERYTINECLLDFHFIAKLVSIEPTKLKNGDTLITKEQVEEALGKGKVEAVIIRSLPNDKSKLTRQYSGTNPPFFHPDAMQWLVDKEIKHLVTDFPSVDKESDGGKLLAHRAFWQYPQNVRKYATITELVYIESTIPDGLYLLNIHITSLEMDASPSKLVLYALNE